jgi:3D (Asp-Asp-Asp) domain-containing protein
LHLALAVALLFSFAVMVSVPIARGVTNDAQPPAFSPAGKAFAEALGVQSSPLATAIAAEALGDGPDQAYTEAIAPVLVVELVPHPLLAMAGELMGESVPHVAAATGSYSTFTLHQDGLATSYSSSVGTVGEALAEAGVTMGPGDFVQPPPETELSPGLHVFVDYALEVRLVVAGEAETVYTQATTVAGLLDEQRVALAGQDRVYPRLGLGLTDGMRVTVTTLRVTTEYVDEPLAFKTVYAYDANLYSGEQKITKAGHNGHFVRAFRVTRINGEKAASELLSERVVLPVDQVVAIGTFVPPPPVETPGSLVIAGPGGEITCARTLGVWATWYTAATSGGSGITKTGTHVYKGIIATDPSVIPLGTHMYVPGYGFGIAADTGGGIRGNMIDLGYGPNDVVDWRTGPVEICILG